MKQQKITTITQYNNNNIIHGSSIMAAQSWQHIFSQQSNNNNFQSEASLPSVSRSGSDMPLTLQLTPQNTQDYTLAHRGLHALIKQFLSIPTDDFVSWDNITTNNLQGTITDATKTLKYITLSFGIIQAV